MLTKVIASLRVLNLDLVTVIGDVWRGHSSRHQSDQSDRFPRRGPIHPNHEAAATPVPTDQGHLASDTVRTHRASVRGGNLIVRARARGLVFCDNYVSE